MQKPKNISEYTVIEQQAIIDELEKILKNHKEDYYSAFYTENKYTRNRIYKNIYFYVPLLNSFFYINTNYLANFLDNNYNSINNVGDALLKYNKHEIFNIHSLEDVKHRYFFDFNSIIFIIK